MFDFQGQVVLITGAAGNLGQAAVAAFHQAGAQLVLLDRSAERLEQVFGDLAAPQPLFVEVNLLDSGTVEAAVHEVVEQLGQVDVLVNIAGGFRMGPLVHETPLETWDFLLELNAKSVLITARAVVPHMVERKSGRVISIGAQAGVKGAAKMGAYTASKSAVIRLTEAMAAELAEHGIRVNCVLPGTIDTPQNRAAMPQADVRRWVTPAALADVILFLASPAGFPINGVALPVG